MSGDGGYEETDGDDDEDDDDDSGEDADDKADHDDDYYAEIISNKVSYASQGWGLRLH